MKKAFVFQFNDVRFVVVVVAGSDIALLLAGAVLHEGVNQLGLDEVAGVQLLEDRPHVHVLRLEAVLQPPEDGQ